MIVRPRIVSRRSILTICEEKLSAELAIIEKAGEKLVADYRPYKT
jgi:hypothetical protein